MRIKCGRIGSQSAMTILVSLSALFMTSIVIAVQPPSLSSDAAKAAAQARGRAMKIDATVATPKIIAVRIRHDMCPFCKRFDPQFPKMIRKMKEASVLFVTLDLTNKTTQRQAAMLVAALGLENVWTGDLSKMGTIIFVDGKTKIIISTAYQEDEKIVLATLRKALISSR